LRLKTTFWGVPVFQIGFCGHCLNLTVEIFRENRRKITKFSKTSPEQFTHFKKNDPRSLFPQEEMAGFQSIATNK